MKIPKYARYKYCSQRAYEFLKEENFTNFPIDVVEFIKNQKWALLKYSELAKLHGVTIKDICQAYSSEEGYTIFNGRNYTIAYNDTVKPKGRIYFTLMHEIGHIRLNHFNDFDQTILRRFDLTSVEYKVLENEANGFARNVMAPAPLIGKIKELKPEIISMCFKITIAASITRIGLLKYDLKHLSTFQRQFEINLFKNFMYKKQCLKCGYGFISQTAKYCPICCEKLIRGDGHMKFKEGIQLDENNHATICPKCENEDISPNDIYCHVCGAYLIQRCSDITTSDINGNEFIEEKSCGNNSLKSNSRFCPICGHKSTFYKHGYLESWEKEKIEIEKAQVQIASTIDEDIPF